MKQNNHETGEYLIKENIEMKQNNNQSEKYFNKESILADYRMANLSRSLSVIGRKEVSHRKGQVWDLRRWKRDNPAGSGKAV